MPNQTETPHKSSRRSRRSSKKPSDSASPQPASHSAGPPADASPSKKPGQTIRILRRGDPECTPDTAYPSTPTPSLPQTPRGSRPVNEDSTKIQSAENESAPKMSQKKRRILKVQGGRKQSASASPLPTSEATPSSTTRHNSLIANPVNGTPVRAYAGPTFHASPAASSLPMPKFFSRSVPNVDKTKSLKSMMEQDTAEITSESEGSPLLGLPGPLHSEIAREESPLDIFFLADKTAKARGGNGEGPKSSFTPFEANNTSPSRTQDGIHARSHHSRGQLNDGIFPLEMESQSSGTPSTTPLPKTSSKNLNFDMHHAQTTSNMEGENRKEEWRKAQTLALKKLLYSSKTPGPTDTNTKIDSPFSGQPINTGSFPRDISNRISKDQNQKSLPFLNYKQITSRILQDTNSSQRSSSSNLREEVMTQASPDITNPTELPANLTPTDFNRSPNSNHPPYRHEQRNDFHSSPQSYGQLPSGVDAKVSINDRSIKSIENDLRRILKLEVLDGDGVPPLSS